MTYYDAANGILSITKARVSGIDRDRTKIAEDRRVVLCDPHSQQHGHRILTMLTTYARGRTAA